MPRRATLTISLPPALAKRIAVSARDANLSRSAFIVAACEAYLDEVEVELKMFAHKGVREAWLKALQQPGVLKSMAEAMGHELTDRERQQLLKFMNPASPAVAKPPPT